MALPNILPTMASMPRQNSFRSLRTCSVTRRPLRRPSDGDQGKQKSMMNKTKSMGASSTQPASANDPLDAPEEVTLGDAAIDPEVLALLGDDDELEGDDEDEEDEEPDEFAG